MTEFVQSNNIGDYYALTNFVDLAQQSLATLQKEYTTYETALTNTPENNLDRRKKLRKQMNKNIKYQKKLNKVIGAAMDVAATNETTARTTFAQALATVSVLDTELANAAYNIKILNQDQIKISIHYSF